MAICEFDILTGLLLHTENRTAEIFGGESRGNKAGFYCISNWKDYCDKIYVKCTVNTIY
jgi:hypothetical protein